MGERSFDDAHAWECKSRVWCRLTLSDGQTSPQRASGTHWTNPSDRPACTDMPSAVLPLVLCSSYASKPCRRVAFTYVAPQSWPHGPTTPADSRLVWVGGVWPPSACSGAFLPLQGLCCLVWQINAMFDVDIVLKSCMFLRLCLTRPVTSAESAENHWHSEEPVKNQWHRAAFTRWGLALPETLRA